jgi:uncharacterized DUF497 family protein
VHIEYDPIKDLVNQAKHGVSLEAAARAAWDVAVVFRDGRWDYGEIREIAFVPIDHVVHVVIYTTRQGRLRIISVRRANHRERKKYVAQVEQEILGRRSERGG